MHVECSYYFLYCDALVQVYKKKVKQEGIKPEVNLSSLVIIFTIQHFSFSTKDSNNPDMHFQY